MIDLIIKYLDGELTPDEKKLVLLSVNDDEIMRKELVELAHLSAYVSLVPQKEDNIKAQRSLTNFLKAIDNKKDEE